MSPTVSEDSTTLGQQRLFIQQILAAVAAPANPLLIILTMRSDFLHRAAELPALAHAISEHVIIISPMTPTELRSAIVQPAETAGGSFESGLVDELIAQAHGQSGRFLCWNTHYWSYGKIVDLMG